MPVCQVCGREFKVINSNHLSSHGLNLQQYIDQYGDPNKSSAGGVVTRKASKPRSSDPNVLTANQAKSLEDLYEMERTIQVPKTFYWVDEDNEEIFERVLDLIYQYGKVAVDTETTGLDPFHDRVTHLILTPYDPARAYNIMIPVYHEDRNGNKMPHLLDERFVIEKVKPILESPDIRTCWFNHYFDYLMLLNSWGIRVHNIVPDKYLPRLVNGRMVNYKWRKGVDIWDGGWDGYPASMVLNENDTSHKMKDLYRKYCFKNEPDPDIKALDVETFEEQFGKIRFFRVPKRVATCYGAKDGYITRRMEEFQRPYIDGIGDLDSVLYTIEFPLMDPLARMRQNGIKVNMDTVKVVGDEVASKKDAALEKVKRDLGENINLNSPKQVSQALYVDLGLPDLHKGSTKASVLEELADLGYDVAQNLIDFKKMEKLESSFINPIEDFIAPDGHVHPRFPQIGTKTGRFSSSESNLQQVPARYGVIRTMFEADDGKILVGGDFSQIEPRLTAHTCQDEHMIQSYVDGKDLYSMLAAKTFSLLANRMANEMNHRLSQGTLDESNPVHGMAPLRQKLYENGFVFYDKGNYTNRPLTAEDCYDGTIYRKTMKTLLLGIMYGMSGFGMAARLKISEEDATSMIDDFFKAFPKLKTKMNEINAFCQREGYVNTEWGRKRRIPEVWSEDKWVRRRASRQCFNSVIQGGAADMMKMAMNLVFYDPRLKDLDFDVLLTVHDELICSVPRQNAYKACCLMIEDMVGCADLRVPLKVDAEIYVTGQWYADSGQVKVKNGEYKFIYDGKETDPSTMGLTS